MRYLALCACVKWEWPWLREWVEFYRLMGVEHFYIYSNEDKDEEYDRTAGILRPYIDAEIMQLFRWPGRGQQIAIYNHCINQSRGQDRWLGLLDLDEFAFPVIKNSLAEYLHDYEDCPGLAANWRCFGNGGHLYRPNSQLQDFLYRPANEFDPNVHVKCFVNPLLTSHMLDVHRASCPTYNENRELVVHSKHPGSCSTIRINHYIIRSIQDFWEVKVGRGRIDGGRTRTADFLKTHNGNDVYDDLVVKKYGNRLPKV